MDADHKDVPPKSPWGERLPTPPASPSASVPPLPRPGRNPFFTRRLLIIGAVLVAIAVTVAALVPVTVWRGQGAERLVYLGILGVALVFRLAAGPINLSVAAKQASIWVLVFAVVLTGYAYRDTFREVWARIAGDLVPSRGVAVNDDTITFPRSRDGHFWIDTKVDGTSIRFMVDTGASSVVLSGEDARRLGFDLGKLSYTRLFSTANGTTRGASVLLRDMKLGPLVFHDVGAVVNEGEMKNSLLGMHLLEQFSRIEITRDTLTIRR